MARQSYAGPGMARSCHSVPQHTTLPLSASTSIPFIAMCMLIICDNVWEVVLCRVRLRYGPNQREFIHVPYID